ncbi:glial cell line-derived neurotrophic factor [Astyanax mexicanus]|uniref:Glial cell line-derived neurotrophic factor-like n=1 Tax=Astyanax mexicanus TaxID=7994 RepID=A0A8T2KVB2_ASTMX|nr:glial cell line-derived neurotrophic factor [Astyanax mexicanus]KAG9261652.1 glial cell line-derived neurotrophic factor-like [Astyanax mexicanus]
MKLLDVLLVVLLVPRGICPKPLQKLQRTEYLECPEPCDQNQNPAEPRTSLQTQSASQRGGGGSLSSLQAKLNPPVLKVSLSPGSGGRGRCGLRQVQVRVSEVGLGYLSEEELIFRYCSGRCLGSTNYDRILGSLAATGVLQGAPPPACCRPTAYERRLAFLDQHLSYHLLKKHSARRCGCV